MLNTRSEKAIAGFVALLDDLRGMLDGELGELVEAVLERTGYRQELEASSDPQDLARLDNLNELVSVAHEFSIDLANAAALREESPELVDEDVPDTGVLAQFLERVSLVADADDIPEHGSGVVTMMTLHTAKGLEFPIVFVTGWEDGMFPHMRALGDPLELSEERRLAYVGITRARQRLYLSRAKVRSSWGQPMLNPEPPLPAGDPAGTHRLAAGRGPAVVVRRAHQRRRAVRGAPAVTRPDGDRPQPAGHHAGTRRPRHSRQVRPRSRRGGLRHGGVRHVADRLRQRRPGQADAQPRADPEALTAARRHRHQRPVAGSNASTMLASGAPECRRRSGAGLQLHEQAAKIISATTSPTTISSRPMRRRSSSEISPPMVAAAETADRKPIAMQNNSSVRHQSVISDVAITAVAQPLRMLTVAAAAAAAGEACAGRPGDVGQAGSRDVTRLLVGWRDGKGTGGVPANDAGPRLRGVGR